MAHFTITLPNNLHGDVRCGTIRKKSFFLDLFKTNARQKEEKKGYIIKIEPASPEQKEYRLLKTMDGKWTTDDNEGFKVTADDTLSIAIKNAIDNYERQH
jgi:hypothetical protein